MSSHMLSLVWNGHYRTLLSVFEKLLESSHLVDCTIASEGQKLKAHKEVLSAFSPYFELLFREETGNDPIVILSGISFKDLRSLIDFIYQGKLEVSEDRIEALLDVAQCLQIKGLGGIHEEKDSGSTNNTSIVRKRLALSSSICHKRKRKIEDEETASTSCKEADANHRNFSFVRSRPHNNTANVPIGHLASQTCPAPDMVPNLDVQDVSSELNIALIPAQLRLSPVEMSNSLLHSESVVKTDTYVDVENDIEPMSDTDKEIILCEMNGNSNENIGEETILGLFGDCSPPRVVNSPSCSGNLIVSSERNELDNNMSLSLEPSVPTIDTNVLMFHSEFLVKTEPRDGDETLVIACEDVRTKENECSGQSIFASPVLIEEIKVEEEDKCVSDCSGPAPGCTEEDSTFPPQQLDAVFTKTLKRGNREPVVNRVPGLLAEGSEPKDTPRDSAATLSRRTVLCEKDHSGTCGVGSSVRMDSTKKQYRCHLCGKTFLFSSNLMAHTRTHTVEKPYRCDKCNYASASSFSLKNHKLIHNERQIHKCTKCDFKSAHPTALELHQRVNCGFKPYKCTQCDFTTLYKWTFIRHQDLHSSLKRFKCTDCNYSAARNYDLTKHRRSHSGLKPFKCTKCDYASAQSSNLLRHLRKHCKL